MEKNIIRILKDFESLDADGRSYIKQKHYRPLAITLKQAINVMQCCETLKDKEKLNFDNWKFSKGIRHVSGHNYKDNDGDLYDSDELEKMYQHYLSL